MHSVKKHIPNIFTFGNLFCGFLGVILTLNNDIKTAIYLMIFAAFLDFWDGFAARKLGVSGDFGKELDSLADLLSFGMLPAAMFYQILKEGGVIIESLFLIKALIPFFGGIILLATAARLAKFNTDEDQSEHFKGLASPASALLVASIAWSFSNKGMYYPFFWFNELSIVFILLIAYLMNSGISMFSLKFKDFSFSNNAYRYILIIITMISLIFLNFEAVPLIIVVYILLSIIYFKRKHEIQS